MGSPKRSALHSRVHIGVVNDDKGILAAQLQPDLLHMVAGHPHNTLAGGRVTSKTDLGDFGMPDHGFADLITRTWNHIDRTSRCPRLGEYFGQLERAQGTNGRRLDNAGVAGDQGRPPISRPPSVPESSRA